MPLVALTREPRSGLTPACARNKEKVEPTTFGATLNAELNTLIAADTVAVDVAGRRYRDGE